MNWHIVGSNGYIAKRLLERKQNNLICYSRQENKNSRKFNLARPCDEDFELIKPNDFVVLLAAVSSPDECHKNYEQSYQVNVTGTAKFIDICLKKGAKVLFFSSDAVIGDTKFAKDETMTVNPVGEYGQMKYEIEQRFSGNHNFKVFRLSYVLSNKDKFIGYLQQCRQNNSIPNVFDALYRNVIYIEDVIDAIFALEKTFDTWSNNIFHLCGNELLSRKNLAELYKSAVDSDLEFIVSIPKQEFFDARPNVICSKSLYLEKLLGREPTSIAQALKLEFKKV